MKLAIRTLAVLLALSSTAVAEDWTNVPIIGGNGFIIYDDEPVLGDTVVAKPNLPASLDFVVQVGCNQIDVSPFGAPYNCPPGTYIQGATFPISVSQFARSDRLDSVSGRVSTLEASVSTFATTTSLNGVAARVAAIEASVGSLATTSNLNALSSRVAGAESQLAAIRNSVSDLAAFVPEALGDIRRQADEGSAMAAAMTTVAPADGKANRIGFNTATYNGSTAVAVSYSRAAGDVDFNVGVAMAGDNAMVKAGAGFSW